MNLPHYPATLRNRDPILSIIQQHLPETGYILETASGTGEHLTYFAQKYPLLQWQPSDKNDELFWGIRTRSKNIPNVLPPKIIDVTKTDPMILNQQYDAIFNINMIHISPWQACLDFFSLAARIIKSTGLIYMYGPYKKQGQHTSYSNETFDTNLRTQNPAWGVRDMEEVISVADNNGFYIHQIEPMPANNYSLVFYSKRDQDTNL
jgi:cyclopropane fatty-acyl-phospholipid synthase-like methyltransferase